MGNMNNVIIGGATVSMSGDVGYITDGITLTPNVEHYFVERIELFPGRHRAARTSENYTITFTMEEPTFDKIGQSQSDNLQKAWDITNAESGGSIEFGGDSVAPQEHGLVIQGIAPDQGSGWVTRFIGFDRVVADAPGEMKFTDFEETKIPASFSCLYSTAQSRLGYFLDS